MLNRYSVYLLNRKNLCVPAMGLVTVFCPPMTTGAGEFVVQTTGEPRFVVDCKVKPMALVGHVKIASAPYRVMASCGSGTILAGISDGILGPIPNGFAFAFAFAKRKN